MSDRELGWLEGMIDGDGSLFLGKTKMPDYRRGFAWNPKLSIGTTSKAIAERVKAIIGEGAVYRSSPPRGGKLEVWNYRLGVKGLRRLLPKLQLVEKERQRVLVLEAAILSGNNNWWTNGQHDTRLEEIWTELRILNRSEMRDQFHNRNPKRDRAALG